MINYWVKTGVIFGISIGLGMLAGSMYFGNLGFFRSYQLTAEVHAQNEKSETKVPERNPYPGIMDAPTFEGGNGWLNTAGDIKLSDLKGKIVLLDFWTYCCINCMHILPDLEYLEKKYPNQLVVVGVHSAKFKNEKDTESIRHAIMRYEIKHPVINDSEMVVWDKFNVSAWPTMALIDPTGKYVGHLSGEGKREVLDKIISDMIAFHRAQGTLDETPVKFKLESEKVEAGALKYPGKLLADEAGNRLFISDSNHNRIVVSDLAGKLLDIIGNGSIGKADGNYTTASFFRPQGMELVDNKLYVADTENHSIRVVDLAKKEVTTLAGTGKQARSYGPGGSLKTTALNSPWDITNVNGTLYIAMAGPHQLWTHQIGSDQITVFAGSGREDILDGSLEDCALAQPSGIVHIGKTIYFVDSEGSALRKLPLGEKQEVSTVAGPHDLPRGRSLFEFADKDGTGDLARFQHPIGLGTDGSNLYVCDSYNHKIRLVNPETREVKTLLGNGKAGISLEPLQLSEPAGLVFAQGKMFVADTNNHRIVVYNPADQKASVLNIEGLTAPQAVNQESAKTAVQRTEISVQKIKLQDGKLQVEVEAELKDGFKLNTLAEPIFTISENAESKLLSSEKAGKRIAGKVTGNKITVEIPANGAGNGSLLIDLNYQYCREGTAGICKVGNTGWMVPVTIDPQATESAVKLKVVAK